jgi:serine/threonine protein kinase
MGFSAIILNILLFLTLSRRVNKVIEQVGQGGMGVLYKAEDAKLKRTVALKFLPPELLRDKETKERFPHEAQAPASLNHTNICTKEVGKINRRIDDRKK